MSAVTLSDSKNKSKVSIEKDGALIITDHWLPAMGLTSVSHTIKDPVYLVDHGLLKGEEPFINGLGGTYAFYIHGCPLKCKTCYQPDFFAKVAPLVLDKRDILSLAMSAVSRGAHSLSFVIGTFQKSTYEIIKALKEAKFSLPIVYNYSGMMRREQLERLLPLVDIWVPDLKSLTQEGCMFHSLPQRYRDVTKDNLIYLFNNLPQKKTLYLRHLLIPQLGSPPRYDLQTLWREIDPIIAFLTEHRPFKNPVVLSLLKIFYDQVTNTFIRLDPALVEEVSHRLRENNIQFII